MSSKGQSGRDRIEYGEDLPLGFPLFSGSWKFGFELRETISDEHRPRFLIVHPTSQEELAHFFAIKDDEYGRAAFGLSPEGSEYDCGDP
jgi:hypothetical protein